MGQPFGLGSAGKFFCWPQLGSLMQLESFDSSTGAGWSKTASPSRLAVGAGYQQVSLFILWPLIHQNTVLSFLT